MSEGAELISTVARAIEKNYYVLGRQLYMNQVPGALSLADGRKVRPFSNKDITSKDDKRRSLDLLYDKKYQAGFLKTNFELFPS